jgi:hypothetical protein
MEDDKERNRSDDDAGNNDQQDGTAEGWSFVGWRDGGGCHERLDAESTRVRFLSGVVERRFSVGFCKVKIAGQKFMANQSVGFRTWENHNLLNDLPNSVRAVRS